MVVDFMVAMTWFLQLDIKISYITYKNKSHVEQSHN